MVSRQILCISWRFHALKCLVLSEYSDKISQLRYNCDVADIRHCLSEVCLFSKMLIQINMLVLNNTRHLCCNADMSYMVAMGTVVVMHRWLRRRSSSAKQNMRERFRWRRRLRWQRTCERRMQYRGKEILLFVLLTVLTHRVLCKRICHRFRALLL